jgi:acetyl esterase
MSRSLDPQAQALLDRVYSMNMPLPHELSVEHVREVRPYAKVACAGDVESVGNITDLAIEGPVDDIPLRIYEPKSDGPHPALVYFHGGGWVFGNLDAYDANARTITNLVNCIVVSVDYRLAPENPFPAAVEDAFRATKWVEAYSDRLKVDPNRIAVCGDSSGGNLAAAVSLMAKDRGGPDLSHQCLIYPMVNPPALRDFPSYQENSEGYFLEYDSLNWFCDQYIQREIDVRNEYAFPILAHDLGGLPSTTIITCEFDPLRDEGLEYADRLDAAGISVEKINYEGMIHGFLNYPNQIDRSSKGYTEISNSISRSFGEGG